MVNEENKIDRAYDYNATMRCEIRYIIITVIMSEKYVLATCGMNRAVILVQTVQGCLCRGQVE